MYNFFADVGDRRGDRFYISGRDYNHIKNVLRIKPGENFLVSREGKSALCRLAGFENDCAVAEITEESYGNTSLSVKIYLFQGLPKADKTELIIQKAVELGAQGVIPVEMSRSVVKLDDKKKESKRLRWQAIAESAAKQSKRASVPKISAPLGFDEALKAAEKLDLILVPYENEGSEASPQKALKEIKKGGSVGIFIGPEGGFSDEEIAKLRLAGGKTLSLGRRILRTETAAILAVGMCMLYCEWSDL